MPQTNKEKEKEEPVWQKKFASLVASRAKDKPELAVTLMLLKRLVETF